MRRPALGESNLGALIGAVVGAIGGLFAIGIAPSVIEKDIAYLFGTPILSLIGWLVSVPIGWVMGGQISPRLEAILGDKPAGAIGGVLGGLVPVTLIGLWGWYLVAPH